MSPPDSQPSIGRRTADLWSLGVVLFELVLRRRPFPGETIGEVIAMASSEVRRNRISLQTQLANDLPLIRGDKIQLQQVILNLLINAIEAIAGVSAGPRELLVSSEKVAEIPGESPEDRFANKALAEAPFTHVLIAVRDSGPGLDPKDLDRLFEAFYTTKPGGSGIGLVLSQQIAEAHGGSDRVQLAGRGTLHAHRERAGDAALGASDPA